MEKASMEQKRQVNNVFKHSIQTIIQKDRYVEKQQFAKTYQEQMVLCNSQGVFKTIVKRSASTRMKHPRRNKAVYFQLLYLTEHLNHNIVQNKHAKSRKISCNMYVKRNSEA